MQTSLFSMHLPTLSRREDSETTPINTVDASRTTSLPQSIASLVPQCAQACISTYLQSYLPSTCSSISDFSCLCTHYSKNGYSLGEISLACADISCPGISTPDQDAIYAVCASQSAAVSPTHSTLTYTLFGTVSPTLPSTSMSTPTAVSNTHSATTTVSAASVSTTASTTSNGTSAGLPGASSTSQTLPIAATSTADSPAGASTLTSAQAAGVSVAAMGGLVLLLALFPLLCCCLRRRNKQKEKKKKDRHSFDFVDRSPVHHSPMRYGSEEPQDAFGEYTLRSAQHRPGQSHDRIAVDLRSAGPSRPIRPSRSASPASVQSLSSERTVSQLLPDKPVESPTIRQTRTFRDSAATRMTDLRNVRDSAATRVTEFEEDSKTPRLQASFSQFPRYPANAYLAKNILREEPSPTSHYTRSPDDARPRPLFVNIPDRRAQVTNPTQSPRKSQIGIAHGTPNPLSAHPPSMRVSMPPSSAASYLPSYYTSNDSRTPILGSLSPRRRYYAQDVPPLPRKPVQPMRKPSRASDTSFESVDPEEPTPPTEDDKQLTPLQESPISGLRYPKVPRSSNQAIPRSPLMMASRRQTGSFQAQRPMMPSTLLAKRRGDDAPSALQQGLWTLPSQRGMIKPNGDPRRPV